MGREAVTSFSVAFEHGLKVVDHRRQRPVASEGRDSTEERICRGC